MATGNKIDHGFYKTVKDKKAVSWEAMLNVSSRLISVGQIGYKLVIGIVSKS